MLPVPSPYDLTTVGNVFQWMAVNPSDYNGVALYAVHLTAAGTGYPNNFTVAVNPVDGNGSGAVVTGVAVAGVVQSLTITQNNNGAPGTGKGYTQPPNLVFPTGTGAAATAYLVGQPNVQLAITAASAWVHHYTDRGNATGALPAQSPFVQPVSYGPEYYNGNGNFQKLLRNWPITAVSALLVNGVSIPQSNPVGAPGWTISDDGKSIYIVQWPYGGGYVPPNTVIPGCYRFAYGQQNISVTYTAGFSGVPTDLEEAVRSMVVLKIRRRGWVGRKSEAMAGGGGTYSFTETDLDPDVKSRLQYYRRQAVY